MSLIDLTGQRFGRLTVISRAKNKANQPYWLCKCDCGNEVVVRGESLRIGLTKSCGCLKREQSTIRAAARRKNRGLTNTKFYHHWQLIKDRCYNSNAFYYKNYGGRGISMFPEWINNFGAFYDYVSKLPHFGEEGYTLDRINNNGNYEPDNLRWADSKTQSRNKRNTIYVEYQGTVMSLADAAELSGIPYQTLYNRYHAGDRGERLFRPVRKRSN